MCEYTQLKLSKAPECLVEHSIQIREQSGFMLISLMEHCRCNFLDVLVQEKKKLGLERTTVGFSLKDLR